MDITESQRIYIINRRKGDASYSLIYRETGIGRETIRRFCIQNGIDIKVHPNVIKANERTAKTKNEKREQKETYTCKHCGEQYVRKSNRDGDQGKQYCSRECAFGDISAWKGKRITKKINGCSSGAKCNVFFCECVICGDKYTTKLKNKKVCSDECNKKHTINKWRNNKRIYKGIIEKTKQCSVCGKEFKTYNDNLTVCSRECTDNLFKAGRTAGAARRRARKRGVNTERFKHIDIFNRDGWKCQLCHKPIAKAKKAPHPMSATIDHIIPLSTGGQHTRINVQTAHFICNSIKGDRIYGNGEQLRLYG